MTMRKLLTWMAIAIAAGSFSSPALAECGGTLQCIGISATSVDEARINHHPETRPVTMAFGNQAVLSTTVKTLHVAAVTGPPGAARLGPIVISGPDKDQFSLVGGSCPLAGGNGPTHGDVARDACTILVRFFPGSPGSKRATLTVPLPDTAPGNVDRREAALTGIGGNERISPLLEADVASLIAAQLAAQRRFAAAQVRNISNRLDSLHRAKGFAAGSGLGGASGPRGLALAPAGAASGSRKVAGPFDNSPAGGGLPVVATGQSDAVSGMLASLLTSGQLPLMLASDSGSGSGVSDGGYWLSGSLNFGRTGAGGSESRFETSGFTFGADRRVRPDLVLGGAAGYSRAHSTFGTTGSDSRFTGQSLALYGSWELFRDTYFDAILGYGTIASKSRRFVSVNQTIANGDRDGSQVHGSIAISKELNQGQLSWAPYARLEFNRGRLDRVDESGAGIGSLSYHEQQNRSSRLALGMRASASHEIEFGRVVPHLRIEYGRELQRVGAATISYADQPGGPTYSVAPAAERRSSGSIGIGAELLTHAGVAFGFELASNGRIRENPEYATRFWLSTALDNLQPRPQGLAVASRKTPFTVSAALRHDTNITRTRLPTPELSDRIWTVAGGIDNSFELSDSLGLTLAALASAEKFQTFDRLDTASLDLRAELAHQAAGLFTSPRFGVFGAMAHDSSRSDLRTGNRLEIGASARFQVAERSGVSAAVAHQRRSARGAIFDTSFTSLRAGADHQLGERGSMRMALEARRGDFVSSGIPAADSAAVSEALADDDAFPDKRFVAYRFRGRSLLATLGYRLSLGPRDSFDIAWTGIRVKPTQQPDYTRFTYPFRLQRGEGGRSPYSVQQIDLSYTMRF